jgi:hypothetical protein
MIMEKRSVFVQEIYTEIKINAPADTVYTKISDFANYSTWTNEITVSGDTRPGGAMCVRVKTANDGKGWYTLSSKMHRNDIQIISFDNVLISPLLLLGEHRFEIERLSDNQTLFINAEVFHGLLIPFIRKKDLLDITRRFKNNFNLSLKKAVEFK